MSDSGYYRREFLGGLAGAAGLTVGSQLVTGADPIDGRFVVDTRSASSDAWKDRVEVLHEFEKIGAAVVRGNKSDLSGLRYTQDFEIEFEPPEQHVPDQGFATEPDFLAGGPGEPNPHQWDKMDQSVGEIHNEGITGEGARISVIDTGVDPFHPDLDDSYDAAASYTWAGSTEVPGAPTSPEHFHGTHVAGIATGEGDLFALGTAPDSTVISHNVFGPNPFASFGDILGALYASMFPFIVGGSGRPADVVNLSLGAYPVPPVVDRDIIIDLHERVVNVAYEVGMLPVAAAGNDGSNLDADEDFLSLPNEVPGFMSVSATGPIGFVPSSTFPDFPTGNPNTENGGLDAPSDLPALYTNYGPDAVDVSAAGGNAGRIAPGGWFYDLVFNAFPDESAGWVAGTSMSAPQVSGLAALVKSRNPDAATEQVRQHIRNTAEQVVTTYDVDNVLGERPTYFGTDGWLADPYRSATYRGQGHLDVVRAAIKNIPFEGGIRVDGDVIYPADPNDDGLYEDVRGDGVVDMDDVQALYQLALRGAPYEADFAFDFNQDGFFDMRDVQALLRRVEEGLTS